MDIQELRELKQFVLDKFQNTKDKNLKQVLRHIDKLIKRKVIEKVNDSKSEVKKEQSNE